MFWFIFDNPELALSQELRQGKNVMDKIWDRKSFEVGCHWPLWRGWNNRMTTQKRQKLNAKNNKTDLNTMHNTIMFMY